MRQVAVGDFREPPIAPAYWQTGTSVMWRWGAGGKLPPATQFYGPRLEGNPRQCVYPRELSCGLQVPLP